MHDYVFSNQVPPDFAEYFGKLGYKTSWDFSRKLGKQWNEILTLEGKLICQIDSIAPLDDIIEDLICTYLKIPTTSKTDYDFCAPESKEFDEFLQKIYDNTENPLDILKAREMQDFDDFCEGQKV